MLFDSLSRPFRQLIEGRARANSKDILTGIKEEAQKWRPAGHKALSAKRRDYYDGRQAPYLRSLVVERNPVMGPEMTLTVFNYFRLIASQTADNLSGNPTFEIDREGAEEAFNELVISSRLVRFLKENERRKEAGRTQFLRPMPNVVKGRMQLDSFWAADVDIVPHPGAPTSTEHALAIMARVSGEHGTGKDTFEVWTKEGLEPDAPYTVTRIDADGNETLVIEDGDGRTWPLPSHPFVAWHAADPDGLPYLDDDHDLTDAQDSVNMDWTLLGQMIRHQAASALVYTGNDDKPLYAGPGLATRIGIGESLQALDFNAKLDEVRESIKTKTRALAVTRRQNPDAYAEEPGPPLSGVSRKIMNQPQEEARRERMAMTKEVIEDYLLPKLCAASDAFFGTNIHGDDAVYTFTPDEVDEFEDPDIRQRRVLELKAEKLITKERAAVMLGLYETEEEAAEELGETQPAPVLPQVPSSFGQKVLSDLASQKTEDVSEDDGGE